MMSSARGRYVQLSISNAISPVHVLGFAQQVRVGATDSRCQLLSQGPGFCSVKQNALYYAFEYSDLSVAAAP